MCEEWSGVDINEFPLLKKWLFFCLERPAFEEGRNVPSKHKAIDQLSKTDEELAALAAPARKWVQSGMLKDAK